MGEPKEVRFEMKIGVIGLGSIGQRHVRCLKELGYTDIVALRTKKGTLKKLADDLNFIEETSDIEEFYSKKLDGVIIANPTSFHIASMKVALEKELPIFVEKPISNSLAQLNEIKNYDTAKVTVGFCLRFHEITEAIKKFLSEEGLGRIYKANLYVGQYLPSWHPYAEYQNEYYAREELGGGAIRTLSHEIDLMLHFFGKPKELTASVEKISDLEIDVDDNVIIINKMADNSIVKIELDFLNPESIRSGIIIGAKGKLEYSFSELKVEFTDYNKKKETIYNNKNLNPNKMYISQMKEFIELIKNNKKVRCAVDDSIILMKIIKAAEEPSKKKIWIKVM